MDWPEPEVRARPADEAEIPRGCKSMVKLAEANGWEHKVFYSRGVLPVGGNQWNQGPLTDCVVLKAKRGDLQFWAAWHNGKFECSWVHSTERRNITPVNSTDLRRVLTGELE